MARRQPRRRLARQRRVVRRLRRRRAPGPDPRGDREQPRPRRRARPHRRGAGHREGDAAPTSPRAWTSPPARAPCDSAPRSRFGDRTNALARLSFDLAWELDVFGRVRSQTAAARARYLASVEAHRDVGIRLVAEVARAYFELRELDDLLAIAGARCSRARSTWTSRKSRFEGGKTSEIDFRQAESEYYRTETVYVDPSARSRARRTRSRALLGRAPGAVPRGRGRATSAAARRRPRRAPVRARSGAAPTSSPPSRSSRRRRRSWAPPARTSTRGSR